MSHGQASGGGWRKHVADSAARRQPIITKPGVLGHGSAAAAGTAWGGGTITSPIGKHPRQHVAPPLRRMQPPQQQGSAAGSAQRSQNPPGSSRAQKPLGVGGVLRLYQYVADFWSAKLSEVRSPRSKGNLRAKAGGGGGGGGAGDEPEVSEEEAAEMERLLSDALTRGM